MTTVERLPETDSDTDRRAVSFACRRYTLQGIAAVELSGDIDIETAPTVRTVLLTALRRSTGPLFVDLAKVTFLDSTGLTALVAAYRRANAFDRDVLLVAPSPPVRKLLTITGLDRLFTLQDRLPPAVGVG